MRNLLRDAWRAVFKAERKTAGPVPENGDEAALVDREFQLVQAAHQAGRLSEAREGYARILGRFPQYVSALHFLGVVHGQDGNLAEAERLIRQSIDLQPLPEYFSNLVMLLNRQGRQTEALAAARTAVQRCKEDSAEPAIMLGDLLVSARRHAEAEDVFRNALHIRPRHVQTCRKLADLLSVLGRQAEAVECYRQVLLSQSDDPAIPANIAILLVALGRHDEAETGLLEALRAHPDAAVLHYCQGRLLQDTDRHAEAESAYRRAVALKPDYAEATNSLGVLLKSRGMPEAAETAFCQSIAAQPDYVLALSNLGLLFEQQARYTEAEEIQKRVLALSPSAEAHFNLANVYLRMDRNAEAEEAYRNALSLNPDYPDACSNLGALLNGAGRMDEAEKLFRHALTLNGNSAIALYNLGGLLLDRQRHDEAESFLEQAIRLQPDLAEAHNRLGTLYKETGRIESAEVAYRRALDLRPEAAGILTNLALLLHESGRLEEAEDAYHRALEQDPAQDLARYNFSLMRLSQGRLCEGWEDYECRWRMKGFNALRHQGPQRAWQGEPVEGESMVVWQEQGIGDVILYAGLVPDLLDRKPRLVIECESRLVALLQRSFPDVRVVMRTDQVHPDAREARWQSPLGSLCRWLRRDPDDFKWRGPYLVPDAERVAELRQRYRTASSGPVIGISWRSGNYKVGVRKSLPLQEWASVLRIPGATFVSLQYGLCDDELEQLEREHGVRVLNDATVDPMLDLDGFAAQVAAMDLVISTSNSTVHFAGALDVPAWVLLPSGDALLWYWFRDSEHCPWYPAMRLFRQGSPGDWMGVLEQVQARLAQFIQEFPVRQEHDLLEARRANE